MVFKKKEKKKTVKQLNKKGSPLIGKGKKLIKFIKKISEEEKQKKLEKKMNPNVSIKPKGFFARKMGVITFWSLFGFMFLVVILTLLGGDKSSAEIDLEKFYEENYNNATSSEAIQFAENFTKDYFTWKVSDDGKHKRKEKMALYLAEGLNEYAGVDMNSLEWNSTHKKSELKRVEGKGKNLAHITFKVNFELSQGKDKVSKKTKFFVVPVAYDGYSFGVYELPKFTYIQEETTLQRVINPKLNQGQTGVKKEIEEFLGTFFTSYTQDGQDKLNYFLSQDNITDGLEGTMLFSEVNDLDVLVPEEMNQSYEEEYIAFVDVTFIEPDTKLPFQTNYQLRIIKKEDRYMVAGIDDLEGQTTRSIYEVEDSIFDEEINVDVGETNDEQSDDSPKK